MRHWGSIILSAHCRKPKRKDVEPNSPPTRSMQIFQLMQKFFNHADGISIMVMMLLMMMMAMMMMLQETRRKLAHFLCQFTALFQQGAKKEKENQM